MIEIVPYSTRWEREFREIAGQLRAALGDLALRIDHIGSTSVPELDAKDIVDIQIAVASLDAPEPLVRALEGAGYVWNGNIGQDHIPPQGPESLSEWQKLFFNRPPGERRVNVHARIEGRANQRYALLFRDYLRTHPAAAAGYAEVKRQLARQHPNDIGAYLDVKDPVCDIIMAGAHEWAALTRWEPGPPDA